MMITWMSGWLSLTWRSTWIPSVSGSLRSSRRGSGLSPRRHRLTRVHEDVEKGLVEEARVDVDGRERAVQPADDLDVPAWQELQTLLQQSVDLHRDPLRP